MTDQGTQDPTTQADLIDFSPLNGTGDNTRIFTMRPNQGTQNTPLFVSQQDRSSSVDQCSDYIRTYLFDLGRYLSTTTASTTFLLFLLPRTPLYPSSRVPGATNRYTAHVAFLGYKPELGSLLPVMDSSSALTRLSPEILQAIAHQVQVQHAPSVPAFALVNRQCFAAAAAVLFRKININIGHHDFAPSVIVYKNFLQTKKAFDHVRTLTVTCASSVEIANDSSDWQAVVELLDRLGGLKDFIFGCDTESSHGHVQSTPFPRLLFYALHERHPRCRLHLHVRPDWLKSLYDPTPDRYKMDLIASPLLHSLSLGFRSTSGLDSEGLPVYCEEELMFVSRVSPSLKEISISRHATGWSPAIAAALHEGRVKPAWPGVFKAIAQEVHQIPNVAGLQRLQYVSEEPLSPEDLTSWVSQIDFTLLESFEVKCFVPHQANLEGRLFPRLGTASVQLQYPGSERCPDAVRESWLAWEQVLCQDHPLTTLTIVDGLSHIAWNPFLDKAGKHLTSLRLDSTEDGKIGQEIAEQLKAHCRLLENLTIIIKRTQGDYREVQVYRALGSLPRLQRLSLTLEASNTTVLRDPEDDSDDEDDSPILSENDLSFDDFGQQKFPNSFCSYRWPRNGHIQQALINSAFDKTLALAIFDCISAAKPRGKESRLLELLRVRVRGGADLGQYTTAGGVDPFPYVFRALTHCWILKRSPRDDRRDQIDITEGPQIDELRRTASYSEAEEEKRRSMPLPPELVPVFRSIWPAKTSDEAANWRQEWFGLPLKLL